MPRVGFEPTIPAFERAKTVHVLDRAETVSGKEVLRTQIHGKFNDISSADENK
jgi:hypothetical protein